MRLLPVFALVPLLVLASACGPPKSCPPPTVGSAMAGPDAALGGTEALRAALGLPTAVGRVVTVDGREWIALGDDDTPLVALPGASETYAIPPSDGRWAVFTGARAGALHFLDDEVTVFALHPREERLVSKRVFTWEPAGKPGQKLTTSWTLPPPGEYEGPEDDDGAPPADDPMQPPPEPVTGDVRLTGRADALTLRLGPTGAEIRGLDPEAPDEWTLLAGLGGAQTVDAVEEAICGASYEAELSVLQQKDGSTAFHVVLSSELSDGDGECVMPTTVTSQTNAWVRLPPGATEPLPLWSRTIDEEHSDGGGESTVTTSIATELQIPVAGGALLYRSDEESSERNGFDVNDSDEPESFHELKASIGWTWSWTAPGGEEFVLAEFEDEHEEDE